MTLLRAFAQALLAAALAAALPAHASGGGDPTDDFVSRSATDVAPERYDAGQIGVLLPTYPRLFLYPAWRAIVLGPDGLRQHPSTPNAFRDAVLGFDSWTGKNHPQAQWLAEAARLGGRPAPRTPAVFRPLPGDGYGFYVNCPRGAFEFATRTLQDAARRADATPARLAAWVAAQDAVFDFCDYDPKARPLPGQPARAVPAVPVPLAAGEPVFWQQLRDYQIASAHFYNESYVESRRRFDAIGATAGHPMRTWGAYLALRSQLRALPPNEMDAWNERRARIPREVAALAPGLAPAELRQRVAAALAGYDDRERAWHLRSFAPLQDRANQILADASLEDVHEATRATLRAAQYRLLPRERFEALGAQLADTARDPHRDSALNDWRRLANDLLETGPLDSRPLEADLRKRHAYFDWMRALALCGLPDPGAAPRAGAAPCAAERAHALARWKDGPADAAGLPGERQAWFVAALLVADRLSPELEKAALAVPPSQPEYLTVRYAIARLYRLAGQPAQARDISDGVLAGEPFASLRSDSAATLFRQERFATATTLADAAGFVLRQRGWIVDRDTGETRALTAQESDARLAADGLAWLDRGLAVADLLVLARDTRLPSQLRGAIVAAAWMRAELLDQAAQASEAATMALQVPGLKEPAQAYLAVKRPEDRRHQLLLASIRLGMSPVVRAHPVDFTKPSRTGIVEDEPLADTWCGIARKDPEDMAAVERTPAPPDVSAVRSQRDAEVARLARIKTATGYVGDHVLAWARTHPTDPDVPWLLHVVVLSTRGGCLDADHRTLSRTAWQLLHSRYAKSEWADKTPVWY